MWKFVYRPMYSRFTYWPARDRKGGYVYMSDSGIYAAPAHFVGDFRSWREFDTLEEAVTWIVSLVHGDSVPAI